MIKNKFILSIIAATCTFMSSVSQGADRYISYEYTPAAGSEYNDVTINFIGASSAPSSSYKEVWWQAVGAVGAYSAPDAVTGECQVSPETVVNNVTMYVDLGTAPNQQYISAIANGTGIVMGNSTLTMKGGFVELLHGGALSLSNSVPAGGFFAEQANPTPGKPYSRGNVTLNVCGTTKAGSVRGGCGTSGYMTTEPIGFFTHSGNITINVYENATVTGDIRGGGGSYGCVDGDVAINISGNAVTNNIYGGARNGRDGVGAYVKNTVVTISENAQVKGNVYGGGSYDSHSSVVKGSSMVVIKGGTITGNVYGGGKKDIVEGNSLVVLEGGSITGTVYGSGADNTTEGTATVQILSGDWSETQIFGKTETAEVKGGTQLIIGSEDVAYTGLLNITGFDVIQVAKGSKLNLQSGNVFDVPVHNYTITANNLGTDGEAITIVTPDADLCVNKPITLNFSTEGRVISGRYKVIDATQGKQVDTSTNWDSEHVTVTGQGVSFDGLVWDGNVLYVDYVSPVVGNVVSGNWGVFKSSQAFTGTLWGNRANACVLSTPAQHPCTDAKGNCIPAAAPTGTTLAWGTVYGQSARISGAGADYSVYGGAVGVEHQFVSGRSIGAALGYDWGEVSPFGYSEIDQESFHAAVYGRAGIWQLGANSAVAVDLSAAYGSTESDTAMVSGDWQQDSLQLDARVSYLRQLGASTTGSVFAGVQYYAADSDTVDGMEISSMQNLRTEIGAGVSHKATENTSVYGEISVYNDAMRHNPYVADGGNRYYGTNPGRLGGSISVGAQYDLNDNWSVRGSYSFDAADDSTEHNLNAGAVYKF